MSVLTLKESPSGVLVALSDTIVDPGELLGNPLDAAETEPAEPITGAQAGAILRLGGFSGIPVNAGTYHNFEIPDGVQVMDLDPVGGTVIITGIKLLGDRGNAGGFITIGKFGNDGTIIFRNEDAGSDPENQIQTPDGIDYELIAASETCDFQVFEREGDTTKWQIVDRLIPASGVAAELNGLAVPCAIAVTYPAGAGGAPDDVTVLATVPFQVRILDVIQQTSTAVGGSTVTLRNQAGGGGAALSSALSTAATGTVRNNDTTTRNTSLGLFLRRSDSGVAGTVIVLLDRV